MQRRHTSSRTKWAAVLAVAVAVGIGSSLLWKTHVSAQAPPDANGARRQAEGLSQAFRKAAEVALPTVVQIKTFTKVRDVRGNERPLRGENPFRGTPFEDFFNDENFGRRFQIPRAPRDGLGSGVIIDPAGIILTNNHVVEGADEVVVRLKDGREFKAQKVKTDKNTDMALVWIESDGRLPAARLGDSDKMEIGDWVLAIGHPFHLDTTVSAGIISGKARSPGSLRTVTRANFLQTDAAINPGNSGGPLVNLDGEVIGINTAIATRSGGYQGIGFAIPINTSKWVAGQLMKHDKVQRAFLGVAIGEVTPAVARQFGVKAREGVVVTEVHSGTPAGKAGIKDGDIILDFAGHKVSTPRELQIVVERSPLEQKQPVRILRDGKPMTIDVVLEALPDRLTTARPAVERNDGGESPDSFTAEGWGIEVSDMSPQVARRLGYEGFAGVLISRVDPNSVAHRKGLRDGMLILKVGKQRVQSVEEFKAAQKRESLKDGVLLQVRAGSGNRFVVLEEL